MSNQPHFRYIDSLRGIAIAGVILVHSSHVVEGKGKLLTECCNCGAMGVQLFFIASAITLCFSARHRRSGQEVEANWSRFFIRRFFRIGPLFGLAAVFYPMLYGTAPSYWFPNGIKWWFFPLTVTMTHGWHPETINSVVPGGWSIAAEMAFYVLFPFLFTVLRTFDRTLLMLIFALVFSVLSDYFLNWLLRGYEFSYLVEAFKNYLFPSQLPVFVTGIAAYQIISNSPGKNRFRGIVLFMLTLLMFLATFRSYTTLGMIKTHILFGFGFAVLAVSLYHFENPILVNKWSIHLGTLSFSLYICHFGVIWGLQRVGFIQTNWPNGFVGVVGMFLLVSVLSLAVSYVTNRLVERPGILLGSRIANRLCR